MIGAFNFVKNWVCEHRIELSSMLGGSGEFDVEHLTYRGEKLEVMMTTPLPLTGAAWESSFDLAPAILLALVSLLFARPLPSSRVAVSGGQLAEGWALHARVNPEDIKSGLPATSAVLEGLGVQRWVQLQPADGRLTAEEVRAGMGQRWAEGQVAMVKGRDVRALVEAAWGLN